MRALERDVVDAVWAAIEPRLPAPPDSHPLGCHRRRVPDRVCFRGILIRLVTGCSWVDAEAILDHQVSDTTLRSGRDEWIHAGVFDELVEEALAAYDRIIGIDLAEVAIDGSQHKATCGGEGTGPNCTDRGRSGWKWSLATDTWGIPIGWVAAAANNNDCKLVAPTLDTIDQRGLLADIDTLHMDRGYDYDYDFVRAECAERGLDDVIIPKCRKRKATGREHRPGDHGQCPGDELGDARSEAADPSVHGVQDRRRPDRELEDHDRKDAEDGDERDRCRPPPRDPGGDKRADCEHGDCVDALPPTGEGLPPDQGPRCDRPNSPATTADWRKPVRYDCATTAIPTARATTLTASPRAVQREATPTTAAVDEPITSAATSG